MKKIIITTICIFAFTTLLKAQTGIPDNTTGPIFIKDSKVGIGTNNPKVQLVVFNDETLDPLVRLQNYAFSYNNTNGPALEFVTNYGLAKIIGVDGRKNKYDVYAGGLVFKTRLHIAGNDHGYYERMRITASGNVGIGTTNPNAKLHVMHNDRMAIELGGPSTSKFAMGDIIFRTSDKKKIGDALFWNWSFRTDSWSSSPGDIVLYSFNGTNYTSPIIVQSDGDVFLVSGKGATRFGNVGIGTTNPKHKLDVNGIIHAKEVKVDLTGWSDFVFADGYDLPDINEVAQYIETHKHLPDVPTATEVKEKGISLGQMNAKLLQKIEELTLYTIKQEKELKELKKLKQKNSELELRLEKLERLLETANQ